jgi:AAA family ATP:ADP antiporter
VFGASCLLLVAVPTLGMLGVVEGIRRATQYAIYRPARELLFTVVPPVETYGAKGFIDTLVYRGGDVSTVWVAHALFAAGSGITGLALAGLPIAAAWFALAGWLARTHRGLAEAASTPSPNSPQGQPA